MYLQPLQAVIAKRCSLDVGCIYSLEPGIPGHDIWLECGMHNVGQHTEATC